MNRNTSLPHFIVVCTMFVAAAVFLHARTHREPPSTHISLTSFPIELAHWIGRDVPMDDSTLQVLGPGDFLNRIYSRPVTPPVDFFVAYFATQRTGNSIHSPKNCLPGSGWSPLESQQLQLAIPGQGSFPVNRYLIARGDDRQLVLYWYQAHNRRLASEYLAKLYLVSDAITMNRTDGSLVRILTPISSSETADAAQQRVIAFAVQAVPTLDAYIPR